VEGGRDQNGGILYVARADHVGGKIPGKFSVTTGKAYIPWNSTEHEKDEYEVKTQQMIQSWIDILRISTCRR